MVNYAQIAYKIVHQVLDIQAGEVVSLSGEILNRQATPLEQIPLIEDLALALRKKGAFPVLEISTENLKHRFFAEMPEEIHKLPLAYYESWVNSIDAFIDVGWRNHPEIYQNLSPEQYQRLERSTRGIWETVVAQKKRTLYMGYPTESLAAWFHTGLEVLHKSYFAGVDCDYEKLAVQAEQWRETLQKAQRVEIDTVGTLKASLQSAQAHIYGGRAHERQITVLPAGKAEVPVVNGTMEGRFYAEKMYFGRQCFNNILLHFEDGKLVKAETGEHQPQLYKAQDALTGLAGPFTLTLGFNTDVRDYCGYYLFDTCMDQAVGLAFADSRGRHCLALSKNAGLEWQ